MSPADGLLVHNRLTHTLEVAQVARRITERLLKNKRDRSLAEEFGGIDPDVVEAAALIHDLGHPPFGHIAEEEIHRFLLARGVAEGYEGNAQSFRIVTNLECRSQDFKGLNLTRATLNASLKYPWRREVRPNYQSGKQARKWGYYSVDEQDFLFTRNSFGSSEARCTEAEIMDWSDDIAYSIHDTADFFRAGLVPLDKLKENDREVEYFFARVKERWSDLNLQHDLENLEKYEAAFEQLRDLLPNDQPYRGTERDRAALRAFTSQLIADYVVNTALQRKDGRLTVRVDERFKDEVKILKELAWVYVIDNPALASQQLGQRHAIVTLLSELADHAERGEFSIFPVAFKERLQQLQESENDSVAQRLRVVADYVSGLTDYQASRLFGKFVGPVQGASIERVF